MSRWMEAQFLNIGCQCWKGPNCFVLLSRHFWACVAGAVLGLGVQGWVRHSPPLKDLSVGWGDRDRAVRYWAQYRWSWGASRAQGLRGNANPHFAYDNDNWYLLNDYLVPGTMLGELMFMVSWGNCSPRKNELIDASLVRAEPAGPGS